MATTRVWCLKGNVQKAIDYICDEEKTEGTYVYSSSASPAVLGMEWSSSNELNNQLGFDAFDHRVGYHFQQSFAPGTVTKEQAMQITQEWIEDISNGQYDYVMALHTDKYYEGLPHYHVHIIVNPKNKVTGKNWDIYYKRDVNKFKDSSDRICASHGLDIIENYKNVSKSYYEWMMSKKGDSYRDIIKKTIETVIPKIYDYDQFKAYLTKLGFEVEDGLGNESEETEFRFSINSTLVQKEYTEENKYLIRVPGTRASKYIKIDIDKQKWTNNNQTYYSDINKGHDYVIYNEEGTVIGGMSGEKLKSYFEDKSELEPDGRKGLRIKAPYSNKFVRCSRLFNEKGDCYSLENVIDMIDKRGQLFSDPKIEAFISSSIDEKEIKSARNNFYEEADIKTKYNQSKFYKMSAREKYIYFRTVDMQIRLDKIAVVDIKDNTSLTVNELKDIKKKLIKVINQVNNSIKKTEEEYQELLELRMESLLVISDEEVDDFIKNNIQPLRQERLNIKKQITDVNKKIKDLEKNMNKGVER